jgi:hypothetical protein
MSSAGGVLVAGDVSVENFHRSARARPPPADTPDEASAITTSQVTSLIQDFAVSLDLQVIATESQGQIFNRFAWHGVIRNGSDKARSCALSE